MAEKKNSGTDAAFAVATMLAATLCMGAMAFQLFSSYKSIGMGIFRSPVPLFGGFIFICYLLLMWLIYQIGKGER